MANKRPRDEQHRSQSQHHQHHGQPQQHHQHHHRPSKAQKTHHTSQHNNSSPRSNASKTEKGHTNNATSIPNISPTTALSLLDAKFPSTSPYPPVPAFSLTSPQPILPDASETNPSPTFLQPPNLPPLPPLQPGPLSTAPFTHPSTRDAKYGPASALTYERLEFLGDAYVEIIATRLIYSRFPHLPCGRQAQVREKLVRNSTLAELARAYGFGDRVACTRGLLDEKETEREKKRGGWEKVEADVFEAFVAAVVLSWPDGNEGFRRAEEWLTGCWAGLLLDLLNTNPTSLNASLNRYDELIKRIGGRDAKLTFETVPAQPGDPPQGEQSFRMGLFLNGWGYEGLLLGSGVGIGKKEANMAAVSDALEDREGLVGEVEGVKRKRDGERRAAAAAVAAGAAGKEKDGLDGKGVDGDAEGIGEDTEEAFGAATESVRKTKSKR